MLQLKLDDFTDDVGSDFSKLCSVRPDDDQEVREFLKQVANSTWSEQLVEAWAAYQVGLLDELERETTFSRRLRVLIAVPVSRGMLPTIAYNIVKLRRSRAQDVFKLALFHYQLPTGQVPKMSDDIENILRPHIVHEHVGPGCKVEFMAQLNPDGVAAGFDYVWYMDGDLRMDYFDWDIYRHVLLDTDPLVSQPSILGWYEGKGGTYWFPLRMRGPDKSGRLKHYRANSRIEQQAPMFSSKMWPAVHARAKGCDGRSSLGIMRFWDRVGGIYSGFNCSKESLLVVNISPLRHADCHDQTQGGHGAKHCAGGSPKADMYNITSEEAELLARGVRHSCEAGGNARVWQLNGNLTR